MLNFGASKPRVKGGPTDPRPPPEPRHVNIFAVSGENIGQIIGQHCLRLWLVPLPIWEQSLVFRRYKIVFEHTVLE